MNIPTPQAPRIQRQAGFISKDPAGQSHPATSAPGVLILWLTAKGQQSGAAACDSVSMMPNHYMNISQK